MTHQAGRRVGSAAPVPPKAARARSVPVGSKLTRTRVLEGRKEPIRDGVGRLTPAPRRGIPKRDKATHTASTLPNRTLYRNHILTFNIVFPLCSRKRAFGIHSSARTNMYREIPESRDFCYILNKEIIEFIWETFCKYDIKVGIIVKTKDGYNQYFKNPEELFEWSQRPHTPIKVLSFSTLESDAVYRVVLNFKNARRYLPISDRSESAIYWNLHGPSDVISTVNKDLSEIIDSTKQIYSIIYSNSILNLLVFDILTLYVPLLFLGNYTMFLLVEQVTKIFRPEQRYFKLPSGQIIEALPVVPLENVDSYNNSFQLRFWKYYGIPYVVFCVAVRSIRIFYPVGVFDFGNDRIVNSRVFGARDKLVWVIIFGIFVGVVATVLVNYYS